MESLLINPSREKCCRILQLTDMHLFGDKRAELLGVNTFDSFLAVTEQIKPHLSRYDLVLATGDIVQDHTWLGYQNFINIVSGLNIPCGWVIGNHDNKSLITQSLTTGQASLTENKVILLKDKWLLILLDSAVEGKAYGELSEQQLLFLKQTLTVYPQQHALIVLHHHPIESGSAWLDQHMLRNNQALYEILDTFPQVKLLLCGHIHQTLNKQWNNVRILSSPSTCVQFKPQCPEFTVDDLAPGWHELTLNDDGSFLSEISFLSCGRFSPNIGLKGY